MRSFNAAVRGAAALAALVLATGGAASPPPPDIAHAYAQFGFDTLRELRAEKPGANVFISPTSIAIALAMVANGAEGPTRSAILQTLGAQDESLDALNAANRQLIDDLNASKTVQLSIANALWLRAGFAANPAFKNALETNYDAQTDNLDFASPAAPVTINAWAAKHTNDRIQKIIESIDPATVLVLANAIAFKGTWTLQFDPKATQPHDFTTAAGSVHSVPMMEHNAKYGYSNADGIETIRLPYSDQSFAMYVMLPQDAATMTSFLHALTPDSFTATIDALRERHGTIDLPRFTIDYGATLNSALEKLGMGIAFGGNANFDGIHPAPPHIEISEVRHASFLKVDEEGTEAAAVTSVGMRATAVAVEPPPFHMIVDRPFFVAIRDERSGQILFTGTIADPGR